MAKVRDNNVKIVGTVVENAPITGVSSKGKAFVRGNLVIKLVDDSKYERQIPIQYYFNELTNAGKATASYITMLDPTLIGKRVSITGEINENRYFSDKKQQIASGTRLRIAFINVLSPMAVDKDEATFIFTGFVVEGLKDIVDNDGITIDHTIKLGQISYSGKECNIVAFNVNPSFQAAVAAIGAQFAPGVTVKISGILDYDVKFTQTETREASLFGPEIVTTINNQIRVERLQIESANLIETPEMAYSEVDVKECMEISEAETRRLEEEHKSDASKGSTTSTATSVRRLI